ncbi:hypothetical protein [Emticicia agri]|uniref:hypothetical protein n=1 Tax=Emticicia agri TaxID=2492393 RepID=UPI001A91EE69|nr:hypothetical protein [Emticicia agri]
MNQEQTGSYAEFREKEFRPLLDKLFAAIYPILSASEQAGKLSEPIRQEFIQTLADRLTSEYFSKAFDYVKKQQKQDAIEIAQRQVAFREAQISAMRNVSLADFKGRILVNLDSLVKERNPVKRFILDNYCVKAFELCLSYFHAPSPSAMNKNKGICLLGRVGTGKSTLLTAFKDNPLSSFRIVKAQDIVESYIDSPDQTMRRVLSEKPIPDEENMYGFSRYDLLIEEVGREQLSVIVRGDSFKTTPVNVMERVLMEIYDHPGLRVHLISNAETPEKLAALYGEAAASRVYDMFNVITLDPKAPNRRFG